VIAEKYTNSTYHYQPTIQTYRWWVPGFPLLVGGSVVSAADWEHVARDFGCEFCINVQDERSDVGTVPDAVLCEAQVSDAHAPPIPHPALAKVLDFALSKPKSTKLYVHCQMGGSRSPAFAYLILRGKFGLSPAGALDALNAGFIVRELDHLGDGAKPFGHAEGHQRYLRSIEEYLANRPVVAEAKELVRQAPSGLRRVAIHYPSHCMGRPINPAALYSDPRGLTGSEVTAIEYAQGLAYSARGYDVSFYANVSEGRHIIDNSGMDVLGTLSFKHDREWEKDQAEPWDAVISFMNALPFMFLESPKPLRIFNMQCGDFGGQPDAWERRVDLLCALSHDHANRLRPTTAFPADQYRVMWNGVDTKAFRPGTKIPGRCVWASSHDRGLHHALELWPKIRAKAPHAELHVFYDLDGIRKFAGMGPTDVPFLKELQRRSIYEVEMMRRLRGHGVVLRGPVSREQMADELGKAEVLLYPTAPVRYTETFGCTVLEAMASGCVPVLAFEDSFSELWAPRDCPGVAAPYEAHRAAYLEILLDVLAQPTRHAGRVVERAKEFEWKARVGQLMETIESRGERGLPVAFPGESQRSAAE
jgi:glycosyltransferase involved in cell wall biosynthesis